MSRLQKLLGVGKGYLERLPPVDVHKLLRIVLMNLPYIVIFYVGNKLACGESRMSGVKWGKRWR